MSILNKLTSQGSLFTAFDGATPPTPDLRGSKQHFTYSLNGNPQLVNKPSPSNLDDISGERYLDNLPE